MERTSCRHLAPTIEGGGSDILENFCTPDIVILHLGYIKES